MSEHDDRLLPSLVLRGMDEGIKTREQMVEAEAEVQRLRTELGFATARVKMLTSRYEMNRKLTLDMWEQLKTEFSRPHEHDKEPLPMTADDAATLAQGEADEGRILSLAKQLQHEDRMRSVGTHPGPTWDELHPSAQELWIERAFKALEKTVAP